MRHQSIDGDRTPLATPPLATSPLLDVAIFLLLVAIGAVGRAGQPVYNFTPIAAVALFAGAYFGGGRFSRRVLAMMVPVTAMLVSNLWLPGYGSVGMTLTVFGVFAATALAGPLLERRRAGSTPKWVARLAVGALAPSLVFYVATNFAHWFFVGGYPRSAAGLFECYVNAIPFYRQMLAGDLVYGTLLFGAAAAAGVGFAMKQPAPAVPRV